MFLSDSNHTVVNFAHSELLNLRVLLEDVGSDPQVTTPNNENMLILLFLI